MRHRRRTRPHRRTSGPCSRGRFCADECRRDAGVVHRTAAGLLRVCVLRSWATLHLQLRVLRAPGAPFMVCRHQRCKRAQHNEGHVQEWLRSLSARRAYHDPTHAACAPQTQTAGATTTAPLTGQGPEPTRLPAPALPPRHPLSQAAASTRQHAAPIPATAHPPAAALPPLPSSRSQAAPQPQQRSSEASAASSGGAGPARAFPLQLTATAGVQQVR